MERDGIAPIAVEKKVVLEVSGENCWNCGKPCVKGAAYCWSCGKVLGAIPIVYLKEKPKI